MSNDKLMRVLLITLTACVVFLIFGGVLPMVIEAWMRILAECRP